MIETPDGPPQVATQFVEWILKRPPDGPDGEDEAQARIDDREGGAYFIVRGFVAIPGVGEHRTGRRREDAVDWICRPAHQAHVGRKVDRRVGLGPGPGAGAQVKNYALHTWT